jgi:hypothetical protein
MEYAPSNFLTSKNLLPKVKFALSNPGARSTDSSQPIDEAKSSSIITDDRQDVEETDAFDPLDGRNLRKELIPFLPYVDKAPRARSTEASNPPQSHLQREPWINIRVLRHWLDTCDRKHGDHCKTNKASASSPWHGPLWLIDVIRQCVVPAQPDTKYFALSYVWGTSTAPESALCFESSSKHKLTKRGSLKNQIGKPKVIPQLIADVIDLVSRLGWRYLWVDRYCIMQDNGPAKDSQISSMNAIYAGAYATFVIADNTAERGLRGLEGQTPPRETQSASEHVKKAESQHTVTGSETLQEDFGTFQSRIDELQIAVEEEAKHTESREPAPLARVASYDSFVQYAPTAEELNEGRAATRKILETQAYLLMHSPWYSRGWTFQEALFSRRKIVFQNDSVNWECHCCAWYEQGEFEMNQDDHCCTRERGANADGGFDVAIWPDLHRYARLVSLFNLRRLTFPEDALFAFGGVTNSLSRTFKFGFISGLPQMFFHSTLIWQPHRPMTRRKAKADHLNNGPILPSWSWAGWHGVVQSESWGSGYAYVKGVERERNLPRSTWQTRETVKWYRLDDAGGRHMIKSLESMYDEDQAAYDDGWDAWVDPETGEANWEHADISDTDFWRPVPLRDPVKAHVPPINCRFITAQTRRAFVKVGETFENQDVSFCACVDLLSDDGEVIGVLRMLSTAAELERIEMIELSTGSVQNLVDEHIPFEERFRTAFERCPRSGMYEFYNVMYISRQGTTGHREGVGRIEKHSWEALKLDIVEIRLG